MSGRIRSEWNNKSRSALDAEIGFLKARMNTVKAEASDWMNGLWVVSSQ